MRRREVEEEREEEDGGGKGGGAPAEVGEQALSRFLSGSSPQTGALVLSCVGVGAGGGGGSETGRSLGGGEKVRMQPSRLQR